MHYNHLAAEHCLFHFQYHHHLKIHDSQNLDLEVVGAAGVYYVEVLVGGNGRAAIKVLKE